MLCYGGYSQADLSIKNLKKAESTKLFVVSIFFCMSSSVLILLVASLVQFGDIGACTFFIELDLRRPYLARGTDLSKWEVWNSDALKILLYITIYFFHVPK